MAEQATTFSAAEAAVYDRQMRLWGVEAQKRLQNSRVLVSGLTALGSELVKNLVLAGMGVTLHDSQAVTTTAVATQFFLSEEDVGNNVCHCLRFSSRPTYVDGLGSYEMETDGEIRTVLQGFKSLKDVKEVTDNHEVDFIQYAREQFQANGLDEDYLSPDELQAIGTAAIMSTALAAARAKTKGKRMLRNALDAYGDEDTSLSKWNARKKQAVEEGTWMWKDSVVNASAAIKSRFDKEEVQTTIKARFGDIQAAMEEEMSSTIHVDQHGGQLLGPNDRHEGQCCWSSLSFEERGSVQLIDSEFDVPGIKECKKEEVVTLIQRHPLAPKYPPPSSEPSFSMETTNAVVVLPSRPPRSPLEKLIKKARALVTTVIHQVLNHPNPVSAVVKEALWRVQFLRRAEVGTFGTVDGEYSLGCNAERWEWLGMTEMDSIGQLSDSMTVGHQRYGFLLPSFAYHKDRRQHMRPVANDPVPNRGHAYKYQYILDLIKDRDGQRGWSLAREGLYAKQLEEEQEWLKAEDARREAKEAEIARKELRRHVATKRDPLAQSMSISKAVFPVNTIVDVVGKMEGKSVIRRATITAIHQKKDPSGERSASFDVEYTKTLRSSFGRLEASSEQHVDLAGLRHVPLVTTERNPTRNVGVLIQAAIDHLRRDIESSQQPKGRLTPSENGDKEALPSVDSIADRLRDCREGHNLLHDHRDFVDFVFKNSTLFKLKWLQVVSHIRYGTRSEKLNSVATVNPLPRAPLVEMLYREFGMDRTTNPQEVIQPMPSRAHAIEEQMAKLGFQYDAKDNVRRSCEQEELSESSARPETTPALIEPARRHATAATVDDMMLFREDPTPQNTQDMHRLIYELKVQAHEGRERLASENPVVDQYLHSYWPKDAPWVEADSKVMVGHHDFKHGIKDDYDSNSSCATPLPLPLESEEVGSTKRSKLTQRVIWLGPYAVCRNLEAKLGIAPTILTNSKACSVHDTPVQCARRVFCSSGDQPLRFEFTQLLPFVEHNLEATCIESKPRHLQMKTTPSPQHVKMNTALLLALAAFVATADAAVPVSRRPYGPVSPREDRSCVGAERVEAKRRWTIRKGDGFVPSVLERCQCVDRRGTAPFLPGQAADRRAQATNPEAVFSTDTPFTLMTDEEFAKFIGESFQRGSGLLADTKFAEEVPSNSTSADKDWTTAVCLSGKPLTPLSEQQVVDCDEASYACQGGFPGDALTFIKQSGGVCTEEAYPYVSGDSGDRDTCQSNCKREAVTIRKVVAVPESDAGLVQAINTQPVAVGVAAGNPTWKQYKSGIVSSCTTSELDHAVLAVGYSSSYFKIKNSWSTQWARKATCDSSAAPAPPAPARAFAGAVVGLVVAQETENPPPQRNHETGAEGTEAGKESEANSGRVGVVAAVTISTLSSRRWVIGLLLFVVTKIEVLPWLSRAVLGGSAELQEIIEKLHMALFLFIVIFLVLCLGLLRLGMHVQHEWREFERSCADIPSVLSEYALATEPPKTWLDRFSWHRAAAARKAEREVVYLALRRRFMDYRSNHPDEETARLLAKEFQLQGDDSRFPFNEYLSIISGEVMGRLIQIDMATWLALDVVLVALLGLCWHAGPRGEVAILLIAGFSLIAMNDFVYRRVNAMRCLLTPPRLQHDAERLRRKAAWRCQHGLHPLKETDISTDSNEKTWLLVDSEEAGKDYGDPDGWVPPYVDLLPNGGRDLPKKSLNGVNEA
ncbi:Cysteine peptidase [Phytophthora cactorum]|nr:Cysteine peptidase [Phytophthora cactorum]